MSILPGAPFWSASQKTPLSAMVPITEFYGERSSVGRVPDCDSGCRGFEPHRSPHIGVIDTTLRVWFNAAAFLRIQKRVVSSVGRAADS